MGRGRPPVGIPHANTRQAYLETARAKYEKKCKKKTSQHVKQQKLQKKLAEKVCSLGTYFKRSQGERAPREGTSGALVWRGRGEVRERQGGVWEGATSCLHRRAADGAPLIGCLTGSEAVYGSSGGPEKSGVGRLGTGQEYVLGWKPLKR